MKTGQYFTALIGKKPVKGRVSIENGNIFLCQNVLNGAECKNKQGMSYSYYVGGDSSRNTIASGYGGITNFRIVTAAQYKAFKESVTKEKKLPVVKRLGRHFGFDVEKKNSVYVFGCGAVKLTGKQIKDFIEISSLPEAKLKNFSKVKDIVERRSITNPISGAKVLLAMGESKK